MQKFCRFYLFINLVNIHHNDMYVDILIVFVSYKYLINFQ
jgi:hypothetical protein